MDLRLRRWRAVHGEMVIACEHLVSMENTMDIAHIFFVHAFGSKVTSRVLYNSQW